MFSLLKYGYTLHAPLNSATSPFSVLSQSSVRQDEVLILISGLELEEPGSTELS